MKLCSVCSQTLSDESRFCTRCGRPVDESWSAQPPANAPAASEGRGAEEMNMPVLYVMVAVLILAVLLPPWETPPGQPPEFLGFHFLLNPPGAGAAGTQGVVSRLLLTIELVTIAVAGLYFSWLFRKKS
ncbi:MAG: hypothetical protein C4293_10230 [Nitrospiraceae bacterium]